MPGHNAQATAYIKTLDSPQKEICEALREIILGHFPLMTEEYKWRYPAYYFNGKRICIIGGFKHHANIELFYGSRLNDTQGRVEGLGKNTRHIKLTSLDEIDAPYFIDLIQQSMDLSQADLVS